MCILIVGFIWTLYCAHWIKVWLVIFPEGTRYDVRHTASQKRLKSQEFAKAVGLPPLEHVLTPRTTGFEVLTYLNQIGSWVEPSYSCYNLTILCIHVLIFECPFRWYLYSKIISFQFKVCNFHYRTNNRHNSSQFGFNSTCIHIITVRRQIFSNHFMEMSSYLCIIF